MVVKVLVILVICKLASSAPNPDVIIETNKVVNIYEGCGCDHQPPTNQKTPSNLTCPDCPKCTEVVCEPCPTSITTIKDETTSFHLTCPTCPTYPEVTCEPCPTQDTEPKVSTGTTIKDETTLFHLTCPTCPTYPALTCEPCPTQDTEPKVSTETTIKGYKAYPGKTWPAPYQCPRYSRQTSYKASLTQCLTDCSEGSRGPCTAAIYNAGQGLCALQNCPIPVPVPEREDPDWTGYARGQDETTLFHLTCPTCPTYPAVTCEPCPTQDTEPKVSTGTTIKGYKAYPGLIWDTPSQCPMLRTSFTVVTLRDCLETCSATPTCTAAIFNDKDVNNILCALQNCNIPVPEPTRHEWPDWTGYAIGQGLPSPSSYYASTTSTTELAITEITEICPSPFVLRGNKCFFIHEDRSELLNWDDSRQRCLSLGGDLAQPKDRDDFINLIRQYPIGTHPVWLGATLKDSEEEWKWLSGDIVPNNIWQHGLPSGQENCMNINHNYVRHFFVNDSPCMKKALFACEFVSGKLSTISRNSFTHSSLEVDWIPPPDPVNKRYYMKYTLKWFDTRSQVEHETIVTAPPYNITGLTPCTSYIITVIPYRNNVIGELSNNATLTTAVDVTIDGYTTVSVDDWTQPFPSYYAYYDRMGLTSCKHECSRQVACTAFVFKQYRGRGCTFHDNSIGKYESLSYRDHLVYMKQGCNSI